MSLGVALGVALMVAIRILNSAAAASLSTGLASLVSRVDLSITREGIGLPQELAVELEAIPGVAAALPVITDTVFIDQEHSPVTLLGIDLPHPRVEEAYAGVLLGRELGPAGLESMARENSVLIPEQMARKLGLSIGSHFRVQTAQGATDLRVGGLLRLGGVGTAFRDALVVADLGLAERMLLRSGHVDRIDIMAVDPPSRDALEAALVRRLPSGATVGPPRGELAGRMQLARAFLGITSGVSIFGLIVGFFLIYNVLSAAILAEAQELARVRLQGATRRDLLRMLLAQAGWQAIPGIVIGAGLGVAMGVVARMPFLQGLGSLMQVRLDAGLADVSWASVVLIALFGLPTAIAASWLAVHRSVATSPLQVVTGLSAPTLTQSGARLARRVSVALMLVAGILLGLEVVHGSAVWGMLAIGTVSALVVTAAAALVSPAATLVRPLLTRVGGLSGELAADGLLAAWSRSAVTIAVFAIGIGTATCTTTIFHSAENLVLTVLHHAFRGDLVITSAFRQRGWLEAPLDIALAREVAEVGGVASVETERIRSIVFRERMVTLRAVEANLHDQARGPRWVFVEGEPSAATVALAESHGVLVSRNLAHHFDLHPGGSISIDGASGSRAFQVVGVVEDFVSAEGSIIMMRDQFATLWEDKLVNHIAVRLDEGRDPAEVTSAIRQRVGNQYVLRIVPLLEFLEGAKELVRQVFHFTRGVTGVILFVATVALLQSIVSGALERRRLLSIFRAVGASKRHLVLMFTLQGMTLGSIGAGLGLIAGFLLSLIWMWIHLRCLLDWVVPICWPWQAYFTVGMSAVIWSSLGALAAAGRLVRLPRAADLVAQ